MNKKTTKKTEEVEITRVKRGVVTFQIKGTTPLIVRRLAHKSLRDLLFPPVRKTAAQRAQVLKHDPYAEFRESPYTVDDPNAPTLIVMPSVCFKSALMGAAIDIPGATKASIGRLAYVEGDYVPIWGIPKLKMDPVRMADIAKTPDIRTRVCLAEWATIVRVVFTTPMLNQSAITNLMYGAGITQGVGDYRIQKGKGNYGGFDLVEPDDAEFQRICKLGRKAQVAAMRDPEAYDSETADLLRWFDGEADRREMKITKDVG